MSGQTTLHVLFTMDCQAPARKRRLNPRPRTWTMSGRSIDSFCTRLLADGHRPTLFCTLAVARDQTPLLEEFQSAGVEIGLLLDPRELDAKLRHYLGHYARDDQRQIVMASVHRFARLLGARPRSVRTVEHSASDETFAVLREAGFTQGSISNPGRRVPKYEAVWDGAEPDPHLAAANDRLHAGDLEFLEVPLTTDATQSTGGVAPELDLDVGEFDQWHGPLAEVQLQRMESERVQFRALCWVARNGAPYGDPDATCTRALGRAIEYVAGLRRRFEVCSMTVAELHGAFRQQGVASC